MPAADTARTVVHADGACKGNPGLGGWGAVLRRPDGTHEELSGHGGQTTNNRMELGAVIAVLKHLPPEEPIAFVLDAKYVLDGIESWIKSWKRNGWRTAAKQPVKNQELWQELDALRTGRDVTWRWTKGHVGTPDNERADELAVAACRPTRS